MTKPLHNQKGTTLVELIVCMVLMALFSVSAVALIHPAAETFIETQRLTRAQNLADALVESLRGELEQADGEISFANGDTGVFADTKETIYSDGTANALQIGLSSSYIEILDYAQIDRLQKSVKKEDGTTDTEDVDDADATAAGYLHMRYIKNNDTAKQTAKDTGKVYAYTTAYPKNSYMGLHIGSLQFYARGWEYQTETTTADDGTETITADKTKPVRLTSLTVVITICNSDDETLTTQQAVIPLPRKPVYSATPLTNTDSGTSSGT